MAREPLAVLLSAVRTPIGTFGGAFKDVEAADLGAAASAEALRRAGLAGGDMDDVIMGCVLQAGAGMNVARQVAVRAGVPVTVPAETVNRVCGSGLQAVVHGVETIRGGYARAVLAGGTESMSRAPYLLRRRALGFAPWAWRGRRQRAGRRPQLRAGTLPHGRDRGGSGAPLQRDARRAGRLRRRKPGAGGARARVQGVRRRDRGGDRAGTEEDHGRGDARRASAARHDNRAAGRAEAGLRSRAEP